MRDPEVPQQGSAQADDVEVFLQVPGDWWLLDLDPRTRQRRLESMVVDAFAGAEDSRETRQVVQQVTGHLRRAARDIADSGGVLAAVLTGVDGDQAVTANAVVAIRSLVAEEGGAELTTADALVAAAAELAEGVDGFTSDVVELGLHGPAVRLSGVRTTEGGVRPQRSLWVQYLAPIPGDPRTALVTLTSPSTGYADALVPLFDAIAMSLFARPTAQV